jgi:hypothetical protein
MEFNKQASFEEKLIKDKNAKISISISILSKHII